MIWFKNCEENELTDAHITQYEKEETKRKYHFALLEKSMVDSDFYDKEYGRVDDAYTIKEHNADLYMVRMSYMHKSPLDVYLPCADFYFCEETLPDLSTIILHLGFWNKYKDALSNRMIFGYKSTIKWIAHLFFKSLPSTCKVRSVGDTFVEYIGNKVIFDILRLITVVSFLGNYRIGVQGHVGVDGRLFIVEYMLIKPDLDNVIAFFQENSIIPLLAMKEYKVNLTMRMGYLHKLLCESYQWTEYIVKVKGANNYGRSMYEMGQYAEDMSKTLSRDIRTMLTLHYRDYKLPYHELVLDKIQSYFSRKNETRTATITNALKKLIKTLVTCFNKSWRPIDYHILHYFKLIEEDDLAKLLALKYCYMKNISKKVSNKCLDGITYEHMVIIWYYTYFYGQLQRIVLRPLNKKIFRLQVDALKARHSVIEKEKLDTVYCLFPWCTSCMSLKVYTPSRKNRRCVFIPLHPNDVMLVNQILTKKIANHNDPLSTERMSKTFLKNLYNSVGRSYTSFGYNRLATDLTSMTYKCGEKKKPIKIKNRGINQENTGCARSSVFHRKLPPCTQSLIKWVYLLGHMLQYDDKNYVICPRCGNIFNLNYSMTDVNTFHCGCCYVKEDSIREHINKNFNDADFLDSQHHYLLQKGVKHAYCGLYNIWHKCAFCRNHLRDEDKVIRVWFRTDGNYLKNTKKRPNLWTLCRTHLIPFKNYAVLFLNNNEIMDHYDMSEGHIKDKLHTMGTCIEMSLYIDENYPRRGNSPLVLISRYDKTHLQKLYTDIKAYQHNINYFY